MPEPAPYTPYYTVEAHDARRGWQPLTNDPDGWPPYTDGDAAVFPTGDAAYQFAKTYHAYTLTYAKPADAPSCRIVKHEVIATLTAIDFQEIQ